MKTISRPDILLRAYLQIGLFAVSITALQSETIKPPDPKELEVLFGPGADRLAIQLLSTDKAVKEMKNDEAFKTEMERFIEEQGISNEHFVDLFRKSVDAGKVLVNEKFPMGSAYAQIAVSATRKLGPEKAAGGQKKFSDAAFAATVDFLKRTENGQDHEDVFLQEQGFTDVPAFAALFKQYVTAGRAYKAYHIAFDSKEFMTAIKARFNVGDLGVSPMGYAVNAAATKPTESPVVTAAKTESTTNAAINHEALKLWKAGVSYFRTKMTLSQQKAFAQSNSVLQTDLVASFRSDEQFAPKPADKIVYDAENKPEVIKNYQPLIEPSRGDRLLMGLGRETAEDLILQYQNKLAQWTEDHASWEKEWAALYSEDQQNPEAPKEPVKPTKPSGPVRTDQLNENQRKAADLAFTNVIIPPGYGSSSDGITRFFQFGYKKLTPYTITAPETMMTTNDSGGTQNSTTRNLEKAEDNNTAFVEFLYANRWAWSLERMDDSAEIGTPYFWRWGLDQTTIQDEAKRLSKFDHRNFDWDIRFSYNFSSFESNDPTSDSPSADILVGSSDIEFELGSSYHLLKKRFPNGSGYSFNVEGSYSLGTQREEFDVHDRYFFGLGYTGSFEAPGGNGRLALLHARSGPASIETVRFIDEFDSTEVALIYGDRVRFENQWGWGSEVELLYPIGKDGLITLGGRIYGAIEPNTWSLQIGYSRPISSFLGGLFPVGTQDPAPASMESSKKELIPTTGVQN